MPQTDPETQTTPKPIQMSPWSVRRILAVAKTETRRAIDLNPDSEHMGWTRTGEAGFRVPGQGTVDLAPPYGLDPLRRDPDGQYAPGRLYVREPVYRGEGGKAYYEADDEAVLIHDDPRDWIDPEPTWEVFDPKETHVDWRDSWSRERQPSMYMPRVWSRILLEVTEVDVHRVQEIDPEEAYAEGIEPQGRRHPDGLVHEMNPVPAFANLWDDLHDEDSWEKNPWVWVIRFDVLHPELD